MTKYFYLTGACRTNINKGHCVMLRELSQNCRDLKNNGFLITVVHNFYNFFEYNKNYAILCSSDH